MDLPGTLLPIFLLFAAFGLVCAFLESLPMNISLETAWPALLFGALLWLACIRANVVEWFARRRARRRARVLGAKAADLTPAIRAAGERSAHR